MAPRPHHVARALGALLLTGAACIRPAAALTYLVGADAPCDFTSLQAAINAAASHAGEDSIRVAGNQSYTAMALTIGAQDLTITGGFATCADALPVDAVPAGSTVIDGGGGNSAPVFDISGSGVRVLEHLLIRNGDHVLSNGAGCGGGVRFIGRGELVIRAGGIAQNDANSGAGICMVGTDSPTALTIDSDVSINNNEASTGNGGGIFIAGTARLYALRDRTLIAFNKALNGDGGGIYAQTPARIDIGSPGLNGLGVLYANEAGRGGALAGYAPDDSGQDSCIRLFTTDPSRPVRLQNNRASNVGGAIYLRANLETSTVDVPITRLYDFRIDGNTATNGPAVFLDGSSTLDIYAGSDLYFNAPAFSQCNEPLADLGRVECTNRAECNRIDNNRAEDFNGQPTNGNVIEIQDESTLDGKYFTMINNQGTRLISASSGLSSFYLEHAALVGNTLTERVVRTFSQGTIRLNDTVIAGNVFPAADTMHFDQGRSLQFHRLLVAQPGKQMVGGAISNSTSDWIVANDITNMPFDPTIQPGTARFVDPARGDYRQRVGSMGVDYAPIPNPPVANERDLDGRARHADLGDVSANTRPRDVGPYERQPGDRWLINGDFASDLRLWTVLEPSYVSWDGTSSATPEGGAVIFNIPSTNVGATERRAALTQCFNVPSSGRYTLRGYGMAAVPSGNRDYPILHWLVRYNSEDCAGALDAEGDSFLGRSGSAWLPANSDAVIDIDPARWTWNTTIEVRLEAAQNTASTTATSLYARFDEVELSKLTDPVFADGFE